MGGGESEMNDSGREGIVGKDMVGMGLTLCVWCMICCDVHRVSNASQ